MNRSVRTMPYNRGLLIAGIMVTLLAKSAWGIEAGPFRWVMGLHLQQSGAGAPLGKLVVPPDVMAGQCTTMVSPNYPQINDRPAVASTVVVQAVIWRSGKVTPMRVISGDAELQTEAMNTVRLWRFKPLARNGDYVDVMTDLRVNFDPNKPGGMITHPNH